jgi:hypothetical protein
MVKTVIPSLPEPGVWTTPHQEAGYTSAAVALDPDYVENCCNRGAHTRPHLARLDILQCRARVVANDVLKLTRCCLSRWATLVTRLGH